MKLNHVLLLTADMDAMKAFFHQALGLDEGFRPPFPFPGKWLYADGKPIIHLAAATTDDAAQSAYLQTDAITNGTGIVDHIALSGDDYDALIQRLQAGEYHYFERTVPETREHQVFVSGPEGVKIEVVFNQDKRAT